MRQGNWLCRVDSGSTQDDTEAWFIQDGDDSAGSVLPWEHPQALTHSSVGRDESGLGGRWVGSGLFLARCGWILPACLGAALIPGMLEFCHWRLTVLLIITSCGGVPKVLPDLPGFGDRDATQATPAATEPPPRQAGAVPLDGDSDWVELNSGEWLSGKFVRLRRGKATFNSKRLSEQTISWGSVRRLVSVGRKIVLTEDGRTFEGVVTADAEGIWIESWKTVRLPRSEVLSVLALEGQRHSDWSGRISLGATYRSGNTDQVDYNLLLRLNRETARNRWLSQYIGSISSVRERETANNHRITSQFEIFLTKRAFLTAPGLDIYRDSFQNIALRATPYVGLGYQVIDTDLHNCSISIGPAIRYERRDSQLPGEDLSEATAAAVFSSRYAWEVTSYVNLNLNYDLQAPIPETDRFNHNLLLNLAVDLPADLKLDIAFLWDRVSDPRADGNGSTPEPDDFRTTIGLGWSF